MRRSFCPNCGKELLGYWINFCPFCRGPLQVLDDGRPTVGKNGLPLKRDVPWLRGKPLSLEHRERISKGRQRRVMSEQTKQRIRMSKLGRPQSYATRRRIRETMKRKELPKNE